LRELPTVFKPKKAKTVLESLKILNNEKEDGSIKWSIKLKFKRLKLVQHCSLFNGHCQKSKYFQNSSNFFGICMFVNSYCTTCILCILFLYIFHESTFQTLLQLIFNLKSQSKY